MTTRSDSDGFSQDSLKVVSLPSLKKDSVGEMMMSSKKEVKSSPFASVLEKDDEPINPDSAEASFSKEHEAMDCHGVVSVPETTTSAFLETSAANIFEVGDDVHKKEEIVEAVVCISEKKGQEDSDVQRLLEAEKRRLLAEVETGTVFMKKDDVETLTMASGVHGKMERVRVKDNAFVGRSMNIDLVDDTALLNVVPFSKKAKDRRPGTDKDAPRKHKKNGGKQIVVVGKQQDKGNASNVVEGNASTKLSETSGNELRIVYSINQMKSMRYAHTANQKKLWSDVYARLLPDLVAEYEGLVSFKTSKPNMRESGNGPVSAVPRRNRVNIFVH